MRFVRDSPKRPKNGGGEQRSFPRLGGHGAVTERQRHRGMSGQEPARAQVRVMLSVIIVTTTIIMIIIIIFSECLAKSAVLLTSPALHCTRSRLLSLQRHVAGVNVTAYSPTCIGGYGLRAADSEARVCGRPP